MTNMRADPSAFLRWFLSPLVAITAAASGRRSGMIAGMSLLVGVTAGKERFAVSVAKHSFTHRLIARSDAFALHVLGDDQDELVYHLGLQSGRDVDKLSTLQHGSGITGTPLLEDCLEAYDCRVLNQMDAGAMTIFLGEAVQHLTRREGKPLWRHDLLARMAPEQASIYAQRRAMWSTADREFGDAVQRCTCDSTLISANLAHGVPDGPGR